MMMSKKKFALTTLGLLFGAVAFACPVCDRAQPKILRGLVHGSGPDGPTDYLIIAVMTLLVLVTLFYSVKLLIVPGEKSKSHIKRTILFND